MAKQFDLVVFDWDGTLMDSTAHIVRALQRACLDVGQPEPARADAAHVIGLSLDAALRHVCPGLPAERLPELSAAYRRHYLLGDQAIELFDGVHEGLRAIAATGTRLAVATGKSRAGLDRVLRETGLTPLFDATRTVDECHSKPHPAMLQELTAELGVEPARTLMVGDTTHDLLMASNAGAASVGVSYGAHPVEALHDCAPLSVFHRFVDFHAWLMPRLS